MKTKAKRKRHMENNAFHFLDVKFIIDESGH